MKQFLLRTINLLLIVVILFCYQQKALIQSETVAHYGEQVTQEDAPAYQDGIYQGTAMGFGGTITAEVTVKDNTIQAVEVLSHDGEDSAYYAAALEIVDRILGEQSAAVDTVSGATFSSTGIRDAVAQALEGAQ